MAAAQRESSPSDGGQRVVYIFGQRRGPSVLPRHTSAPPPPVVMRKRAASNADAVEEDVLLQQAEDADRPRRRSARKSGSVESDRSEADSLDDKAGNAINKWPRTKSRKMVGKGQRAHDSSASSPTLAASESISESSSQQSSLDSNSSFSTSVFSLSPNLGALSAHESSQSSISSSSPASQPQVIFDSDDHLSSIELAIDPFKLRPANLFTSPRTSQTPISDLGVFPHMFASPVIESATIAPPVASPSPSPSPLPTLSRKLSINVQVRQELPSPEAALALSVRLDGSRLRFTRSTDSITSAEIEMREQEAREAEREEEQEEQPKEPERDSLSSFFHEDM